MPRSLRGVRGCTDLTTGRKQQELEIYLLKTKTQKAKLRRGHCKKGNLNPEDEFVCLTVCVCVSTPAQRPVGVGMPLQGYCVAPCKGLVGGTRQRHFDGTNSKPRKVLDCPKGVRRLPPPWPRRTLSGIGCTLCYVPFWPFSCSSLDTAVNR